MDLVAYGESYNQAMQGIEDMLLTEGNPMTSFKKSVYPEAFQAYLRKHLDTINAIEAVYQQEENPAAWLNKLAEHLVDCARAELEGIPKKGKKNEQQINYNMILAVYVFPAILEQKQKNDSAEPLTDVLVAKWNEAFKTSVGKADYEKIEQGFHRKFCYITTAACERQGKADDCYELELLRSYRDEYLLKRKDGEAMVKEYYNIAPTIVNRIGRQEDADAVYEEIWNDYLMDCIHKIENGENEACRERYTEMVYDLKNRYMA
ncbi:MAG: CFI-box-CTERM domain-containing protein [Anaerosacchariphilus sp.]